MTDRLLIFGSREWRDRDVILRFLLRRTPDVVIEGESPGGGADILAREAAESINVPVDPCPVDIALDGPWPAAGVKRNARMLKTKQPTRALGFVVGKRGTPLTRGSRDMAERALLAGLPIMVVREDMIDAIMKSKWPG